MITLVLDTAVVIKWFKEDDEEKVEEARDLRRQMLAGEIEVAVPDILYYEVANYAARDILHEQSHWEEALRLLFTSPLLAWPPDLATTKEILRLARQKKVSAYDGAFLYLAERLQTRLVTSDKELLSKAPELTKAL